MNMSFALALMGFCATNVGGQKVCTPISVINPREHLIDKCPVWAKAVGGKGWTYVNSHERKKLEERQKSLCERFEDVDRGDLFACRGVIYCDGHELPMAIERRVRAVTQDEAINRCVNLEADKYLEALKDTGRSRCMMTPMAERI